MTNYPNPEFPISSADCAAIEAMFIELMRARDAGTPDAAVNAALPFAEPPGNAEDLRSQWGVQ
jgi:hypothetical protein